MRKILSILILCTTQLSYAEESMTENLLDDAKKVVDKSVAYSKKKIDEIRNSKTSRENRASDSWQIHYAPITLGLYYPIKSSWIGEYNINADHSVGIEYLSGGYSFKISKIDLAEFKESVLLIPFKYYFGTNSFFIKYGIGQRSYKVAVGDDFVGKIAKATGDDRLYSLTLLKIKNEVINLGVGNSWQWESGFTFGVEWVEFFIPLGKGKVEEELSQYLHDSDLDNWNTVLKTLETKPSFNFLKMKLGWSF